MRPAATEAPSVVPRVAVKFHLFRYLDERVFSYNLRGRKRLRRTAVLVAAAGRMEQAGTHRMSSLTA